MRAKGFKHSEETREKMRLTKLRDLNPQWKGIQVGDNGLRQWVKRHLAKPILCQNCNLNPVYDLANITGIYDRDFGNWKYMCRKCHMKDDGRINNLKQYTSRAHLFINRPRDSLGRFL